MINICVSRQNPPKPMWKVTVFEPERSWTEVFNTAEEMLACLNGVKMAVIMMSSVTALNDTIQFVQDSFVKHWPLVASRPTHT